MQASAIGYYQRAPVKCGIPAPCPDAGLSGGASPLKLVKPRRTLFESAQGKKPQVSQSADWRLVRFQRAPLLTNTTITLAERAVVIARSALFDNLHTRRNRNDQVSTVRQITDKRAINRNRHWAGMRGQVGSAGQRSRQQSGRDRQLDRAQLARGRALGRLRNPSPATRALTQRELLFRSSAQRSASTTAITNESRRMTQIATHQWRTTKVGATVFGTRADKESRPPEPTRSTPTG
jgi:hypothetical protein